MPNDPIGKLVGGRYRLLSLLGRGGVGSVYLAEDRRRGRNTRVAVKLLRTEHAQDADLRERLRREGAAATDIAHENVVRILDSGEMPDGQPFLVMEALEGDSLAKWIQRDGALSLPRIVPILQQACLALGAAHLRAIVHRDVKPGNVFLVPRGDGSEVVKLLDFGTSDRPAPRKVRGRRPAAFVGTPEYMSPEQASAGAFDHRSDIYSLGIVAYEALTGRLPFDGGNPLATLMQHGTDVPPPLRGLRPELPVAVERVVLRALAKRPSDRPQSMEEFSVQFSLAAGGG